MTARSGSPPGQQARKLMRMERLDRYDWDAIGGALDVQGFATLPRLLSAAECKAVSALYDRDEPFRSTVVMARHGFGRGEYKYFSYPLPPPVADLREALYPKLASVANRWNETFKIEDRFPQTHRAYLTRCRRPDRRAQPRCCSAMAPATIIACIRTSTANLSSRFRSRSCYRRRRRISRAANSY